MNNRGLNSGTPGRRSSQSFQLYCPLAVALSADKGMQGRGMVCVGGLGTGREVGQGWEGEGRGID